MKRTSATLLLGLALVVVGLLTPKSQLVPTLFAQSSGGGLFGPNAPVIVDENGNGVPDPGDSAIGLSGGGGTLTVAARWYCSGSTNFVFGGNGSFTSAYGNNRSHVVTRLSPTSWSYTDNRTDGTVAPNLVLQWVDTNGDAHFDTARLTGTDETGAVSASLSLVGADTNGDSHADHLSIPWSQSNIAGIPTTSKCGGAIPQLWFPLSDTDNDGIPDSIVPDLNGDGVPDSGPFGPKYGPAGLPVPTMGAWGQLLLLAGLMLVAMWSLRRRDGFAASH